MEQKKLSVIIPTIYKKPKVLFKIIDMLEKEQVVDEVILISNAPYVMTFPYSTKLKIYEANTNAFVNESWNFGIDVIQNDNFLIMNDDILIPVGFCELVLNSKVFNDEKTGLIGLENDSVINFHKNEYDDVEFPESVEKINFVPLDKYMNVGFWASAFFGKKENYHFIPEIFRIFYGDNFLLYQNKMRNKISYYICGAKFHHIHNSSSTEPEFKEIIDKDHYAWAWFTLNYINENKYEIELQT